VWIVVSHEQLTASTDEPAAWFPERFRARYCAVRNQAFSGVRIWLFEARPCAPGP
jgi:hypothetical protein